ncbi:hypothetical protein K502DRAFT_323834 [Neoconidiobolus thromboides FSU 785]|nr:hypothetical protein K502DRAFT_323834 [Neoconidiobolus thromboides FSU 785]
MMIENKIKEFKHQLNQSKEKKLDVFPFMKQPSHNLNSFLENCVTVYSKDIDFFQVWLNPAQVFNTLKSKKPTLLSYSLHGMLTRFTSSYPPLKYQHELYHLNLKNAKRCLPAAYANPSIENVTGLVFLTFISFSHVDLKSAFKYFSSAIRMAESLGLNKADAEIRDNIFLEDEVQGKNHLHERGNSIWKALGLTYMILRCVGPELPAINVLPTSISLNLNFDKELRHLSNSGNMGHLAIDLPVIAKKVLEIFFEIMAQIQNVKVQHKQYSRLNQVISNEMLRLPPLKFQLRLQELKYIYEEYFKNEVKLKMMSDSDNNKGDCTMKNKFKSFINAIYIYLFYPSVLAEPMPVQFNNIEIHLLFKASDDIIGFYIAWLKRNLNKSNTRRTNKLATILEAPIFMQITYPTFVLFSILSFESNYQRYASIIEQCKNQSIIVVSLLAQFCQAFDNKYDGLRALNRIKLYMSNFILEKEFAEEIKRLINSSKEILESADL